MINCFMVASLKMHRLQVLIAFMLTVLCGTSMAEKSTYASESCTFSSNVSEYCDIVDVASCRVSCGEKKKIDSKSILVIGNAVPFVMQKLSIHRYSQSYLPGKTLAGKTINSFELVNSELLGLHEYDIFANVKRFQLTDLPYFSAFEKRTFSVMKELQKITIYGCKQLVSLDLDMTANPAFRFIHIYDSGLQHMTVPKLPEGVSPEKVEIILTGNKLICNCAMAWTKRMNWATSKIDCDVPPINHEEKEVTLDVFGCSDAPLPRAGPVAAFVCSVGTSVIILTAQI